MPTPDDMAGTPTPPVQTSLSDGRSELKPAPTIPLKPEEKPMGAGAITTGDRPADARVIANPASADVAPGTPGTIKVEGGVMQQAAPLKIAEGSEQAQHLSAATGVQTFNKIPTGELPKVLTDANGFPQPLAPVAQRPEGLPTAASGQPLIVEPAVFTPNPPASEAPKPGEPQMNQPDTSANIPQAIPQTVQTPTPGGAATLKPSANQAPSPPTTPPAASKP